MAQQFEFRLNIISVDSSWVFVVPLGVTNIGRQAGNELILEGGLVSRHHARIHCTSDACEVADLESANGTFLNGRRLDRFKAVSLKEGDKLKIGDFEITVEQILLQEGQPVEIPQPAGATKPALPKKSRARPVPAPGTPPPAGTPPPPPAPTPPRPQFDPSQPPPGLSLESRRLLGYLPDIYQDSGADDNFLSHYLAIFEAILFPIEWQIDNFDLFLDPKTSPQAFLPWLAKWFDIIFDPTWSEAQRRLFLGEASRIHARQGTRWALSRLVEIYTGQKPEITDTGKNLAAFTFEVKLPFGSLKYPRAVIEKMIDQSKPVHTSYTLVFEE